MKLKKAISILEKLDLSLNYTELITSIFKNSWALPAFGVNFPRGEELIRARPMGINEKRFGMKDDFSFKPQDFNQTFQRASTPNRTMFYAASNRGGVSVKELFLARIIGLAESMEWIRNKSESGIRKIAYGKWISDEPLNLISIVNQTSYHEKNPFVKAVYDDFMDAIVKFPIEVQEEFLYFQDFMAIQFSKEVKCHLDYQISSIFSEIKCNQNNIDGILYPSFRLDGEGINIAIKPESMHKLSLHAAGEFNIFKNGERITVGNCASIKLDGGTNDFIMNEEDEDIEECLKIIGVRSIDDLNYKLPFAPSANTLHT